MDYSIWPAQTTHSHQVKWATVFYNVRQSLSLNDQISCEIQFFCCLEILLWSVKLKLILKFSEIYKSNWQCWSFRSELDVNAITILRPLFGAIGFAHFENRVACDGIFGIWLQYFETQTLAKIFIGAIGMQFKIMAKLHEVKPPQLMRWH